MKFKKEDLFDICIGQEPEGFELIEDNFVDVTRWSIIKEMVFKYKDKYYQIGYSHGATEQQIESPFEYEPNEIECKEVYPVEKTVTVYE